MKKLILLLSVIFINCGNVNAEPNALLEGEVLAHFVVEGKNTPACFGSYSFFTFL